MNPKLAKAFINRGIANLAKRLYVQALADCEMVLELPDSTVMERINFAYVSACAYSLLGQKSDALL